MSDTKTNQQSAAEVAGMIEEVYRANRERSELSVVASLAVLGMPFYLDGGLGFLRIGDGYYNMYGKRLSRPRRSRSRRMKVVHKRAAREICHMEQCCEPIGGGR